MRERVEQHPIHNHELFCTINGQDYRIPFFYIVELDLGTPPGTLYNLRVCNRITDIKMLLLPHLDKLNSFKL